MNGIPLWLWGAGVFAFVVFVALCFYGLFGDDDGGPGGYMDGWQ